MILKVYKKVIFFGNFDFINLLKLISFLVCFLLIFLCVVDIPPQL